MGESTWYDPDDALLAELKEARREVGAVPPRMREAALAAFAWRGVDEEVELLLLAHDSAMVDDPAVRDAGPSGIRTLAFQGDDLSVEIEVGSDIIGQLVPAQPGRVELVTARGMRAEVVADALGCFRFPLPGGGPVRFLCTSDGATVATEWVTL
jgi:hypothetical protein